jgi:hypothetical protein
VGERKAEIPIRLAENVYIDLPLPNKKLINPFSKIALYEQQIMINVPTSRSKGDVFNQQMSLMEREHSKALTEMEEREEDFVLKLKVMLFLKMLFYAKKMLFCNNVIL